MLEKLQIPLIGDLASGHSTPQTFEEAPTLEHSSVYGERRHERPLCSPLFLQELRL